MENIVHLRRLSEPISLPGWLVVLWKLIETLHTLAFIRENAHWLSWLTTPSGNLVVILVGIGWLVLVAVWPPTWWPLHPPEGPKKENIYIAPQGIPLIFSGSRLEIKMSIFSSVQVRLTAINLEVRANTLRPVPMSSAEPLTIEPFKPQDVIVYDKNLSFEDSNILRAWPQLRIIGKASFADGLQREIDFTVAKPT